MRTFERQTCNRCGGSGRYSYNAIHGDMCYGCSGKGTYLTPAGRKAYDAWLAIARPTVTVSELRPGQKLRIESFGKWLVPTIAAIEPDPLNAGMASIKFEPGSGIGSYGAWPTTEFTLAKTSESHRAAWDAIPDGAPGIVEVDDSDAYIRGLRGL